MKQGKKGDDVAVRLGKGKNRNSANAQNARVVGTIKWFDDAKEFEFLSSAAGEDVFVHFRAIQGKIFKDLKQGQRHSFKIVKQGSGFAILDEGQDLEAPAFIPELPKNVKVRARGERQVDDTRVAGVVPEGLVYSIPDLEPLNLLGTQPGPGGKIYEVLEPFAVPRFVDADVGNGRKTGGKRKSAKSPAQQATCKPS